MSLGYESIEPVANTLIVFSVIQKSFIFFLILYKYVYLSTAITLSIGTDRPLQIVDPDHKLQNGQ